jgi:hypothetical protein
MKTFSLLFFLGIVLAQASAQSDKTLVKTFDPSGAEEIHLDFPFHDLEAKPWDERGLRLQLQIQANVPTEILEKLVKAGRYTTEAKTDGNKFIVTAPNLEKMVSIGGVPLEEHITILAKTPGYFKIDGKRLMKDLDPAMMAKIEGNSRSSQDKEKKIKEFLTIKEDKLQLELVLIGTDSPNKQTKAWSNTIGPKADLNLSPAADPSQGVPLSEGSRARSAAPKAKKKTAIAKEKEVRNQYGEVLLDGEPLKME